MAKATKKAPAKAAKPAKTKPKAAAGSKPAFGTPEWRAKYMKK